MKKTMTKGFTLVETLVALVVLAVGMLGIAALYVEGLRASRSAIYRTNAVSLAADMADRIRANRLGGTAYDMGRVDTAPPPGPDCMAGCTPEQIAEADWAAWFEGIEARLPVDSSAEISVSSDTTGVGALFTYQVLLEWPETGQPADQPASYTLTFEAGR